MKASPGWGAMPSHAAANCPDGSYYAADAVLERLAELDLDVEEDYPGAGKWKAQCPAHKSNGLKLYISYGTENPDALLLACHGEGKCTAEEVVEALGMTLADLYNRDGQGDVAEEPATPLYEPPKEKRKKPTAEGEPKLANTFEFTDPTGRYLYHVERWEPGRRWNREAGKWELSGDRKSHHFYRKLPDGKVVGSGIFDRRKNPDAVPHTLFNAVGVARAVADGAAVFITEGMKAAKRLMADFEATATSLDGGAGSEWTPYITGQLSGATAVYLLMDADEGGRSWVRNALAALDGRVGELVVLHSATDKAGDDIMDHLDAGHGLDDMVEVPLTAFRTPAEEWPEAPVPLEHPDLPALPVELFGPLVPMIESMAASFQSPPEYAAFNLLGAISTAVGGMVRVQIRPDWSVAHLGLSVAMVGNPSTRKSDNQREAFAPARQAYLELRTGTVEALKEAQRLASKLEKDRAEELIEKLSKAPADKRADRLLSALSQTEAAQIPLGAPPKMFAEDVTPESLAEQMAAQGGRMAIVSSEGGAFSMIGGMYAGKGRKTNSDIYRKMYSGEDYTVDRKGAESVYIPMLRGVICVMTQPGTLDGWEEAHPDFRETGLLARFIFTLSAPRTAYSKNPPPILDAVREQHAQRIDALVWRHWVNGLPYKVERAERTFDNLTGIGIGVWEPDDTRHQQHTLTLTEAGRTAVVDFDYEINHRIMPGGDLEDVEDVVGKLPERLVRLAACLTLYEDADAVEVSEQHVRNMIRLAPYLIAHGRAAFRKMTKQDRLLGPARSVLAKVRQRTAYGEPFTASMINDLVRKQTSWWSKERGEQAWEVLERYGHVRKVGREDDRKGKAGRPTVIYLAHPATYGMAEEVVEVASVEDEQGFSDFSPRIQAEGTVRDGVSRISRPESQTTATSPGTAESAALATPTTMNPGREIRETTPVDEAVTAAELAPQTLHDLLGLPVLGEGEALPPHGHYAYRGRSACVAHAGEYIRIVSSLIPDNGTACPQCVRALIETGRNPATDLRQAAKAAHAQKGVQTEAVAPAAGEKKRPGPARGTGGRPRNLDRDREILRRKEAGEKAEDIAAAVGCDRASVYNTVNFYKNNTARRAALLEAAP
ncbi:DUF3987 domain-containing protein [Streptomyces sp. NPDC004311]|uniref:DUF3987 domain-containing protein n=1 Tax=Streptomyces sp. NPDC004311 TaxID=3364698 RepID=UPI0036A68ACE